MNFVVKIRNYISKPYVPWFIISKVKIVSLPFAKFLQYGRSNINTKKYWDEKFSSDPDEIERYLEHYQKLFNQVIKLIRPKSTVLDIGCGTGLLIKALRDQKQCKCVGIDISEVSIDMIKKMGFPGYITELPNLPNSLRNNKFDYIIVLETLEHLAKPQKTLKTLLKLFSPAGLLISTVPNDCMSPKDIDEHLHSFTHDSFQALIGIDYSVKECLITKSGGNEYLVCVAEPKSVKLKK